MTAEAQAWVADPPCYSVISGYTCVGFTADVMDAADLWPWHYTIPWASGYNFDDHLEDAVENVIPLPNQTFALPAGEDPSSASGSS